MELKANKKDLLMMQALMELNQRHEEEMNRAESEWRNRGSRWRK